MCISHTYTHTHTQSHSQTGHCLQSVKEHRGLISDIQASADQMMVITASKDNSAKLFDADKLDLLKTFRTERPINSAAVSPIKDHVSFNTTTSTFMLLGSVADLGFEKGGFIYCARSAHRRRR